MKIKVHEIEGNYYCAIDDITVAISKATGTPRSRERCLEYLIGEYDVFVDYQSSNESVTILQKDKSKTYSDAPSGFYRVSEWIYPCTGNSWAQPDNPKPEINITQLAPPDTANCWLNANKLTSQRISHYYISLIDTQIYLSQCDDIDFITPDTPPAEPVEIMPPAEAIDTTSAYEALDPREINSYHDLFPKNCSG